MQMNGFEESGSAKQAAEELWLKVLSDFDNEPLHQNFIDYCATTNQLPLAGQKYKAWKDEKGDSPLIDKCVKRIVVNAQLRYLPDREKGGSAPKKSLVARLFTTMLLLGIGSTLIVVWISIPFLRSFILMLIALVLGYVFFKAKRKA